MTREQKCPKTDVFCYYNANPKNRITGDCAFRAIARATGKPYEQVVRDMAEMQIRTGYSHDMKGIDKLMTQYGWVKCSQPKHADGTKYTGIEFCRLQQKWRGAYVHDGVRISDKIVAGIGCHHVVAIVNGVVNDIWDSTDGCIGNYWIPQGGKYGEII